MMVSSPLSLTFSSPSLQNKSFGESGPWNHFGRKQSFKYTLVVASDYRTCLKHHTKSFVTRNISVVTNIQTRWQQSYSSGRSCVMAGVTWNAVSSVHKCARSSFNPLLPEFFFSSFFGTHPKIGSFCLPTRNRDAHRKYFDDPFLK